MLIDIKDNYKMVEELSRSGEELKRCISQNHHNEVEDKIDSFKQQWKDLECRVSKLLNEQDILKHEWTEFCTSHHLLHSWVTKIQNEIMPLHLNRYHKFKEIECITEQLCAHKEQLLVLQDLSHRIYENPVLHPLAKADIKNSISYLNSCFVSLERVLNYSQKTLLTIHQEANSDKQALEHAEKFLSNMELEQFSDALPRSKQEIERCLSIVEVLFKEGTSHCASVQYVRRKLLLDEIGDFDLVRDTSKTLSSLKNALSKLSTYYLKLCKVYSDSNSIPENIAFVLEFLSTFKRLLLKTPSDFPELVTFYAELQMAGVFVHAHQALVECIIKEGFQRCKAEEPRVCESFREYVQKFQIEWNLLVNMYDSKLHEVRIAVTLWQNYLYYLNLIQTGSRNVEKDLKWYPSTIEDNGINCEISTLQKVNKEQKYLWNLTENAEDASDEISKSMNVSERESIVNQIHDLKKDLQSQESTSKSTLDAVNELSDIVGRCNSNLETVKEDLQTIWSFLDLPRSKKYDSLKINRQETETHIEKLNETSALLSEIESWTTGIQSKMFCSGFHIEIFSHQQIIKALDLELQKRACVISEALNRGKRFSAMHMVFMKWSEAVMEKVKRKYNESPEAVLGKMHNDIENEINEFNNLHKQVISIGHALLESEESEIVSTHISSASAAFSCVLTEKALREHNLKRIVSEKERLVLLQRNASKFLTKSEQHLHFPILFTEVSLKEIDCIVRNIKALQKDIDHHQKKITFLADDTDKLIAESDAFGCYNERYLFQHISQSIINRWDLMKKLSSRQYSYVTEVKAIWKDILTLLDQLNDFICSKENIASKIDYSECDHPRNVYLEGIKVFENLKHCFQDNIHLLHDVNSAYHKIGRKELDVKNCLQVRVLELNDRWHNLYKKVTLITTTITNALQLWADYDQLHQHLHMFITEAHLKLTDLEQSESLNEEECNVIMNDFKLHSDMLQRYYSLANNLKHKSKCSVEDISSQVEEIKKYWSEVYNFLQTYMSSLSKVTTMTEKENLQELRVSFSHLVTETDHVTDMTESSLKVKHLPETQSISSTELLKTAPAEEQEMSFTDESVMSLSESNLETDNMLEATNANEQINSQHQELISTDLDETNLGQREFVKDILAALKEAEDRIESLEVVISELTPSGIEETPPNYARLLAACRSSIDVIRYLNQLLFENPLHESNATSEADIQIRTEDMLNRWDKIENAAFNKELRAVESSKRWKQFSDDLSDIEKWLLDTLQNQSSPTKVDADIEKFISLLQKHEILVSEISQQKKNIINLNATGQLFISTSRNTEALADINEKLKAVNDHWDKLCSVAFEWQNKLQAEFLQSSEFHNTICEMELWLEEAGEKIQSVTEEEDKSDELLHEHHTELFALKQQLSNCSHRVKTFIDISGQFFSESGSEQNSSYKNDGVLDVQSKLSHILDHSQSLLLECTEALKLLSKSLMTYEVHEGSDGLRRPNLVDDGQPTRIKRCCNFLLRVARASFPIQAVLLLLLGAAILLPKEEEELSCRLSNNFASSLNPMLRYPGGPPPV